MKLFKNSIFQRLGFGEAFERLSNRSGQAMVEYVLVLIISVTLLFLAKGLFSSLNNYMSGYVGGYFRCLMTQGELPALGVEERALKKHLDAGYSCSVAYKHGPPVAGGGSGSANNAGTNKELSKAGSTKASASARAGSSAAADKKPSKKSSRSSSDSGDGYDDSNRFTNNPQNTADTYSTADASAEDYDDSVRSAPMAKSSMYDAKPDRSRPVSRRLQENIMKNTRGGFGQKDKKPRTIAKTDDDMRPGPRVGKFNPPSRAVATMTEEPETEMSFGYFLKWIMIAGIGIAIFIFFGGQVMNYTNSDSN